MRRRATLVAFAVVLIAAFACVNYYLALFEHDRFIHKLISQRLLQLVPEWLASENATINRYTEWLVSGTGLPNKHRSQLVFNRNYQSESDDKAIYIYLFDATAPARSWRFSRAEKRFAMLL